MSKDIVVKVGEYEKDGQKKGEYLKVGVILENQNGEYMLLDPSVNLAGVLIKQRILNSQKSGSMVMASIFDRDRQNSQQTGHNKPADNAGFDNFDDDIPF